MYGGKFIINILFLLLSFLAINEFRLSYSTYRIQILVQKSRNMPAHGLIDPYAWTIRWQGFIAMIKIGLQK